MRFAMLAVLLVSAAPAGDTDGFKPLFNGKDFDGWQAFSREVKDGPTKLVEPAGTWGISKDGILICTGKPTGFLITKSEHADYTFQLQWRYPKDLKAGNSGVLVHCQKDKTLGLRRGRFSLPFSLLMPAGSLPNTPPVLTV